MTDVNHVGITVGDINAAIDFYVSALELELVAGPLHCDTTTAGADRRADVFGDRWGGMELAHLITTNEGGVELFQFLEPPVERPEENFRYWRIGPHHVAFTVADVPASVERIVAAGGKQRTAVYDVHAGAFICYCEDPWGNVIEVVSTSYRTLSAATVVAPPAT
jgi:catechol 2,3-dioxygenase-like lactoylglutathione lyase family enzyme